MVRHHTYHLDSKVHKNVAMKTCFFGKMISVTLIKFSSQYTCVNVENISLKKFNSVTHIMGTLRVDLTPWLHYYNYYTDVRNFCFEVVPNGEHESYSMPITQHTRSPSKVGADGHWKHIKGGPD